MNTEKLDEVFDLVSEQKSIPYGLVTHCDLNTAQRERLDQFIKSRGYGKNGTTYIQYG